MNNEKVKMFHCPVEATLSLIGGKYKCIILYHLAEDGILRFSELRRLIPQATPKMLTQQLRELEAAGIIYRKVYPVVPPKTEYSLTEYGHSGAHHEGHVRMGRSPSGRLYSAQRWRMR